MKRAIAILIICLALCGCSAEMHECKVVDKRYQPARTALMPVYNGETIVMIPTYFPEQYHIIIEGVDADGEVCRRSIQVSAADYENTVIGQNWENEP